MNRGAILLKAIPNGGICLNAEPGRWVWIAGVAQEGYSEQFDSAAVWAVNHNLGRYPAAISVRTLGGVLCDVEILHVSQNQLRVNFERPLAGFIEVS